MPSDEAARPSDRPALIRTPDQLQQAKRSEPSAPAAETAVEQHAPDRGSVQDAGVLAQLKTERAHD